jgi:hypothetical protein
MTYLRSSFVCEYTFVFVRKWYISFLFALFSLFRDIRSECYASIGKPSTAIIICQTTVDATGRGWEEEIRFQGGQCDGTLCWWMLTASSICHGTLSNHCYPSNQASVRVGNSSNIRILRTKRELRMKVSKLPAWSVSEMHSCNDHIHYSSTRH